MANIKHDATFDEYEPESFVIPDRSRGKPKRSVISIAIILVFTAVVVGAVVGMKTESDSEANQSENVMSCEMDKMKKVTEM